MIGEGGEKEVIKALSESSFTSTVSACSFFPYFQGSAHPKQRSTPPRSIGRTKGSQDREKGTETVLLVSDTRARRGMTTLSLAKRHPKEQEHGEQAPLTPETAVPHCKAEEGPYRQLRPVFP